MHVLATMPSHVPPHAVPSLVHGVRPPAGDPLCGEQVPSEPGLLHAAHCSPQTLSQQTLSTQKPEVHSVAPAHVEPSGFFGLHTPAEQKLPATQSPSRTQPPAHAVDAALHVFGAQSCVLSGGHVPAPVQLAATVAIAAAHVGARHCVVDGGNAHAVRLVPSHDPLQSVPSPAHAVRPATGAPVTALQAPTLPGTLHPSHWPLHALSQQTPPAQIVELHSSPDVHGRPFPFLPMQTPPVQKSPVMHV